MAFRRLLSADCGRVEPGRFRVLFEKERGARLYRILYRCVDYAL